MKRPLRALTPLASLPATVFIAFTLSLCSPPAEAQINLAWKDCITQPGASADLFYACNGSRNGNPWNVVMSFVAPASLPQFIGIRAIVDVHVGLYPDEMPNPVLPDWWRLGPGECREGNFHFPGAVAGIGSGSSGPCQSPWHSGQTSAAAIYTDRTRLDPWPGHARFDMVLGLLDATALVSGQQYLAGVFTLDSWGDVDAGNGTCGGCCDPAYLVLSQIEVDQLVPAPTYVLTQPETRSYVSWLGCGQATPARNRSWGAIKATYR